MYLAKKQPELLGKIITLGTKLKWTKEISEKEILNLNPETIRQKVPKFAEVLLKMHGNQWENLLLKTAELMIGLGEKNRLTLNEYKQINNKVLLILAEHDKMVSVEETIQVCEQLPYADFFKLLNSSHPIETADLKLLIKIICDFLK